MKTFLPFKTTTFTIALLMILAFAGIGSHAQELVFKNATHVPGSPAAGSDLSVYRFPSVANNIDALVKINGRSSSLVRLNNIDVSTAGFDKAFQPQIEYNNGSVSGGRSWWMEFTITFVTKNTTTPVSIATFNATALDLDGDNSRLHEWVSFYGPSSYTLENPTKLTVTSILQTILGILTNVGRTFDGITNDHSGIDTSATDLMATTRYNNVSSIVYRAGATNNSGSSSGTERNYSLYFKNFAYSSPIISLPVKLISFTAALNQNQTNVDLKWSTASEMKVSHFVIEKSYDGKTFSDAGVMFAYGNTNEKMDYSFTDKLSGNQQVIYYRLRSVDNDSKTQLSETRVVRIGKQAEMLKMVTYPNPVTNELRVTVPSAWQGKALVLELFNQNGQRMKAISTGSASQTETIMVNDLSEGFYMLKASNGKETIQQKVVKN
jgi:hypothetical protein